MGWKHWLTVGGGAFMGGAASWGSMHFTPAVLTSAQQGEGFAIGFVAAGLVALFHLFQPKPGSGGAS